MLTAAQRTALKADITADPALLALAQQNTAAGYAQIADAYNTAANPAYFVWRSDVTQDEIMRNGFDWVRVDNLSVGKARIWEWLFDNLERSIDPGKPNVRAGILAAFTPAVLPQAADQAMRLAIFGHCQRIATRLEKLFAIGPGTTVTDQGIGPSTMPAEGQITREEVELAWLGV